MIYSVNPRHDWVLVDGVPAEWSDHPSFVQARQYIRDNECTAVRCSRCGRACVIGSAVYTGDVHPEYDNCEFIILSSVLDT